MNFARGANIERLMQLYSMKDAPPKRALDQVSLDLYEGEIFALLGHNGSLRKMILSQLFFIHYHTVLN